jgi:hypothetical protein
MTVEAVMRRAQAWALAEADFEGRMERTCSFLAVHIYKQHQQKIRWRHASN